MGGINKGLQWKAEEKRKLTASTEVEASNAKRKWLLLYIPYLYDGANISIMLVNY